MTRARALAGFTLLEMLAAVAVLAIAMAAIMSGMTRYASTAATLREKTVATWIAHNRLTEFELLATWPNIGKSDGEVEMAGIKWKWEAEVKETPDEHLRRIDVRVLRPGSKTAEAISLSGFIADTGKQ